VDRARRFQVRQGRTDMGRGISHAASIACAARGRVVDIADAGASITAGGSEWTRVAPAAMMAAACGAGDDDRAAGNERFRRGNRQAAKRRTEPLPEGRPSTLRWGRRTNLL
jgi:hypothetical protein